MSLLDGPLAPAPERPEDRPWYDPHLHDGHCWWNPEAAAWTCPSPIAPSLGADGVRQFPGAACIRSRRPG